ncbi:hypothetical protein VTH06DRAFT_8666 [Thermothelomyces fergusii]
MARATVDDPQRVSEFVQEAMNTSILGTPADEGQDEGEEGRYGYMFAFGRRRLLFVCNLGSGVESVAQLVRDVDSGEVLVRKVNARRMVHHADADRTGALKKPNEIRVLEALRRDFHASPSPLPPRWIADCYGHEYIESGRDKAAERGWSMYHSVSYWKLCNGQSVGVRWVKEGPFPPASIVGRMARQVLSTLQFLYTAGPRPLYHRDAHLGNVWIHWPSASSAGQGGDGGDADDACSLPLPDFYLGDFGEAAFEDSLPDAEITRDDNKNKNNKNNAGGGFDVAVADLFKFNKGLGALVSLAQLRRGPGETDGPPGYRALEGLEDAVTEVIERWFQKLAVDSPDTARKQGLPRPPDLAGLIERAGAIEREYGRGGTADETRSVAYTQYVAEECRRAAALEGKGPLVVSGSRRRALKPSRWRRRGERRSSMIQDEEGDDEEGGEKQQQQQQQPGEGNEKEEILMRIHGPWKLVKEVGGDWVPVEDSRVSHHRPNGGSAVGIADYELSDTVRPPNPLSPVVLEREGESPARELPLLSFSFAPGDDAGGLGVRPPSTNKSTPENGGKEGEGQGAVSANKSFSKPLPLVEGRIRKWLGAVYGPGWRDRKRQLDQDEEALLKADPKGLDPETRVQRAVAGVKEAHFDFGEPFDFELL